MATGPIPDTNLEIVLAERDAWAQELFESNRLAAALVVERQVLADRLATVEARVRAEASRAVDAARQERDRAIAAHEAALRERDAEAASRRDAEAALRRVTGSTAWRFTAPLRHGAAALLGRPRGSW